MKKDFVIAVDFDGTIAKNAYPEIGEPVPLSIFYMNKWHREGSKLILWTMRNSGDLLEAVDFCKKRGVEFFGINNNPDQHFWTGSPKAYANVYIDDNAFGCPLIGDYVDWSIVGPAIDIRIEKWFDKYR